MIMSRSAWSACWRPAGLWAALLVGLLALVVAHPAVADSGAAPAPKGGLYKLLPTDGKERHHMPAATILREFGYNAGCAPPIRMDPDDHRKSGSHGSGTRPDGLGGRASVEKYRYDQRQLIRQGRFREALQKDIDNIRALFGSKYDEAIEQMLAEYERIKDALPAAGGPGVGGAGCDPLPPGGGAPSPEPPAPTPTPAPAPSITPAYQEIYGQDATATVTVTVAQDPEYDQTLVVYSGDGHTSTVGIPEGTGSTTVSLSE